MFFRRSAQVEATRLGVGGSARNLDDGRVEVIAFGSESAVTRLIDWLRRGPPLASVTSMQITELDFEPHRGQAVQFVVA